MENNILLHTFNENRKDFYFSTPEYEILAPDISVKIPFSCTREIPQMVADMQKKGQLKGKIIVGAIPFDADDSGFLYITDRWEKRDTPFAARAGRKNQSNMKNKLVSKQYLPSPEQYMKMVDKGIGFIRSGLINKLVLSRGIRLTFQEKLDVLLILQRLYQGNSRGYTYALPLEKEKVLIGASPEMLISKRKDFIYSNPLAGSRPRGKSQAEDIAMAEELRSSAKDIGEHRLVVEEIVEKMSGICKNVKASKEPELISTKQLWHLSSIVQGELTQPEQTVLEAALTIYPTPAICGVPQETAYRKILELEGQARGVFTGITGWCDENGDGDWAIAIRGAEIQNNEIFIRAGAGIVYDSIPEEEMKETGVKFRTMLSGIGLSQEQI